METKIKLASTHMDTSAIQGLVTKYDADVYLYFGDIDRKGANSLISSFPKNLHTNALLILQTNGGDPDAAYKIVKSLQRRYARVSIVVNGACKSAGSLIALGADELIMGENGELGPLDIQQRKNDELLGELVSGLNIPVALDNITARAYEAFRSYLLDIRLGTGRQVSTKTASEIAVNLSAALFSKIFDKIDPAALGEIERSIKIAHGYALRIDRGNLKENCIEALIYEYPSHSFVIDYEEAIKLFRIVKLYDSEEDVFFKQLSNLCQDLIKKGKFYVESEGEGKSIIAHLNSLYLENSERSNSTGIHANSEGNAEKANKEGDGEPQFRGKAKKEAIGA